MAHRTANRPATENRVLHTVGTLLGRVATYLFLALLAITIIYPLLWMVGTSLKERQEIFDSLTRLVPSGLYLGHYQDVLTQTAFIRYYGNSILIAVASVTGLLLITSMAAYSFARLQWRGKEALFMLILGGQLVAPVAIIIPSFLIVDRLGLTSTYMGVIVLYLSRVAFGTFILRAFFEGIPHEIEEAAIMDGCSPYRIYLNIMLPLAKPALAAVGIFYFFFVWNDFLYPLIVLQDQSLSTIPVSIFNLKGRFGIAWGLQTAALTMAIVPAVVVTVLFHRWIVRGLTAGAVK